MAISGADVQGVLDFSTGLRQRSREISDLTVQLTSLIDGLPWVGHDRETFVEEWNRIHRARLGVLCTDLRTAADTAVRYADAQRNASRAEGIGGGAL